MSVLSYRPLAAVDLPGCVALLRDEGARGALLDIALLTRALRERRLIARAFVESTGGGQRRLRGCGLSALIEPEFAQAMLRGGLPDPVETVLVSCGRGPPLLANHARVAELNRAQRLYMLVLDFALDADEDAHSAALTALAHAAFLQAHCGYGLCALLAVVRPWERKAKEYRASLAAMGCRALTPAADASQVFELTAEHIAQHPFHLLQALFVRRRPRLGLTPAQQDLLELATFGWDDREIARGLGISPHTVHKRWRAIYERASLLPALAPAGAAEGSGRRGTEKRRLLVEYARAHPEELRPYARRGA
ncbi:MAG: hypothetical protein NZL99_11000 [Burkholderiaceae bacterium]|nr:hypothetical protein [Burkholderiaceae bacterium]